MSLGLCAAVAVLACDLAVVAARMADPRDAGVAATSSGGPIALGTPTTPVPPPTTTTLPPTTTTTIPPPPPPDAAQPGAWSPTPYQGMGAWLDVYDWTAEFTKGSPRATVASIDHMADLGVQTLFIQTGHRRSASDVIEIDRLRELIVKAHTRGMLVVGWYLPMLEDLALDLRRMAAAVQELPLDGFGVDIESLAVGDAAERTRRLLELSQALRATVGPKAISAITPSAVHLQVVNPNFWPGFPWAELSSIYDVIVPMSYWSVRANPHWHSGSRYVAENIDRIRASTRPDMPIHVAGGIADGATLEDIAGMVESIRSRGILGGSLYDWNTSNADQWGLLSAIRVG